MHSNRCIIRTGKCGKNYDMLRLCQRIVNCELLFRQNLEINFDATSVAPAVPNPCRSSGGRWTAPTSATFSAGERGCRRRPTRSTRGARRAAWTRWCATGWRTAPSPATGASSRGRASRTSPRSGHDRPEPTRETGGLRDGGPDAPARARPSQPCPLKSTYFCCLLFHAYIRRYRV